MHPPRTEGGPSPSRPLPCDVLSTPEQPPTPALLRPRTAVAARRVRGFVGGQWPVLSFGGPRPSPGSAVWCGQPSRAAKPRRPRPSSVIAGEGGIRGHSTIPGAVRYYGWRPWYGPESSPALGHSWAENAARPHACQPRRPQTAGPRRPNRSVVRPEPETETPSIRSGRAPTEHVPSRPPTDPAPSDADCGLVAASADEDRWQRRSDRLAAAEQSVHGMRCAAGGWGGVLQVLEGLSIRVGRPTAGRPTAW
eukprot:TRINITY_DN30775_c0_g1_i1.p1 TRINITY_DN30775_c0_g1~~TRINITY_DN30775_c0_g1_i1.p1  ORF type:complete len:267 (+),score=34.78 TRINITY_DN30775_c0_g1_i1:51-803(+)